MKTVDDDSVVLIVSVVLVTASSVDCVVSVDEEEATEEASGYAVEVVSLRPAGAVVVLDWLVVEVSPAVVSSTVVSLV